MSLLDDLAGTLVDASDGLPVPELRRAAGEMESATARLRHAVGLGVPGDLLARLGVAIAHLESGVGLLLRAQDEVATYLATIGATASGPSTVPTASAASAASVPVPGRAGGAGSDASDASEDERWWARRVGELIGERVTAVRAAGGAPEELLRVVAGRLGSRAGLAEALVTAGPGVGLALSGAATARLPGLLEAWLRRPVRPSDVGAVGRCASFGAVLPGLPAGVAAALVARACRVDRASSETDPAGFAVGAAVLAARVAAAGGSSLWGREVNHA